MYQSRAIIKIGIRKAKLRADADRIRRAIRLQADAVRAVGEVAQLGIDVLKTLKRFDIAVPVIFGTWTGATSSRTNNAKSWLKLGLNVARSLLRNLPGIEGRKSLAKTGKTPPHNRIPLHVVTPR